MSFVNFYICGYREKNKNKNVQLLFFWIMTLVLFEFRQNYHKMAWVFNFNKLYSGIALTHTTAVGRTLSSLLLQSGAPAANWTYGMISDHGDRDSSREDGCWSIKK